jgi:hypothetical protein
LPRRSLATTPACSSTRKCRETTDKSTRQHAAISVTLHALAHFARHASSASRVGSPSARNKSADIAASMGPFTRAASRGVLGGFCRFVVCISMQVYIAPSTPSTHFHANPSPVAASLYPLSSTAMQHFYHVSRL